MSYPCVPTPSVAKNVVKKIPHAISKHSVGVLFSIVPKMEYIKIIPIVTKNSFSKDASLALNQKPSMIHKYTKNTGAACIGVLRFKISFMEQGRCEELGKIYLQTLAQLVDDSQLHGGVCAVEQIANSGLGNAAFHIELIRCHTALGEQLSQPSADSLVQLHTLPSFVHGTVPTLYGEGKEN